MDQPDTTPPTPSSPTAPESGRPARVRDPGSLLGMGLAWATIAVISGALFLLNLMGGAAAVQGEAPAEEPVATETDVASTPIDPVDRPPAENAMLTPVSRMLMGLPASERTKPSNLGVLPMFASSPDDQLRITILKNELLGPDETELAFASLLDQNEDDPALELDIEILRAQFAGETVEPADADRMAARHGWFWEVALIANTPEDDPARTSLIAAAQRVTAIILGIELALLLVAMGGLVLFITAVILLIIGRLRPRLVPPLRGGSVFVETFAIFLVAFVGVTIASMLLADVLGPFADLLRWSVLAVAAWPVVRGMSWRDTRMALGLHRGEGVFKEVGCGIIGYIACLPMIGAGIAVTFVLVAINALLSSPPTEDGEVLEAGTDMPVHPIGEMLANAGVLEIVLLVQLATLWAPIVEETFFRGAFYRHTRSWSFAPISGLLTGFIFAAIHPQGWMALPALTMVGFSLAMLREWRDSLIAPIAAHAMNNGTLVTIMLLMFYL